MNDIPHPYSRIPSNLLHTKLTPPGLPKTVISRHNLLTQLDEGITRKLSLVIAPTGYGKTTLVASWVSTRKFSSAWITFDSNDNDPVRFWTYTVTALRSLNASIGKTTLAALSTSQPISLQAALTPMINDLVRLSGPWVLVLDDFHTITSTEVHNSVAFLLQNLPPALHLVLIARSEPELPLSLMRARGNLIDLNADSLRFRPEDTDNFLRAAVPGGIPPSTAALLHERTEGWAAGLQLAVQTLQKLDDSAALDRLMQAFSGSQRRVSDYLIQEVFASQPEAVQYFLLQTCFLNRLNGSLCDAAAQSVDGTAILEQLERENLFISRLQDPHDDRDWYRYHAMFAESLQLVAHRRLGEGQIHLIFERASEWYESHGRIDEAIETALAARSFDRALGLIENYLEIHRLAEAGTLRRWMEQIPACQIYLHPQVAFSFAEIILYTSNRFSPATALRLEPLLLAAERIWAERNETKRLGALHSFRGQVSFWQGDYIKAFEYSRQSLQELSADQVLYRGISLLIVGGATFNAGRILDAQEVVLEARALLGAAQNIYGVLAAMQILSEIYYWQSELDLADLLNQQILTEALATAGDESMLDDRGSAFLGLANTAYERNDLAQASSLVAQAIDLARQRGNEPLHIQAALRMAAILAAQGDLDAGIAVINMLTTEIQNPVWLHNVLTAKVALSVQTGEISRLERGNEFIAAQQVEFTTVQKEREAFTRARIQLAAGKPLEALDSLDGWQADAASQGRLRSQVEGLCLEALAHEANGDRNSAIRLLLQALRLGQSKGLRRLFLDTGPKMAALLQAVLPGLPHRSLSLYVSTLLHSFSPNLVLDQIQTESGVLIEPLSQQELRVLRLLSAGLSNTEIARELVVSRNTIKTQVKSIYRKLNVNSRTEARILARNLNLL